MKERKVIVFTGIILATFFCNYIFRWSSYIGSAGSFDFLRQMTAIHPASAILLYTVFTVAGCVIFTLPGVTFAILAGLLFGPVQGTIYCSLATTLGSMASFLAGRYFLKDSIKPIVMKNKYLRRWLFDESDNRAIFVLMITRLVPLFPYNLQNFAYGITDISFGTYSLCSFIFMLPGTAMYTVGMAGLADREHRILYLGIALIMAAAVIGVSRFVRKKYVVAAETAGEIPPENSARCVHCHKCQEHCSFLKKYGIDIGDTDKLKELSYHCFLCGTCSNVCPQGIDGREILLNLRRNAVKNSGGKCPENGYGALLVEKQNYLFRNKKHIAGKSVLFTGCNFPSFYPETTEKVIELLKNKTDIGVLYDCCGKPVAELGLKEQEEKIIHRLNNELRKAGAEEVIMLCPNCYEFLKEKLDVRVISIYEKMMQLQIGHKVQGEISLFLPCPDRKEREWIQFLVPFLEENPEVIEGIQCCGLGGCAAVKEPELARDMTAQIMKQKQTPVYTYCASCTGNFTRNGCLEVYHFLPQILKTGERPDLSKSMINRAKSKFK